MNDLYPAPDRARRNWLGKIQASIEVLLLSGLVSGFFAILPFSLRVRGNASITRDVQTVVLYLLLESWITFVLLYAVLRANRETLGDIGLRTRRWLAEATIGTAAVPLLFLLGGMVNLAFRFFLPQYYIERNPLTELIRTPRDLLLFMLAALIAGGIKEELQRAFVLTRFREHLGGSAVGLLVWSLAFGAGHYVQGVQGVVAATLFGFLFGFLYIIRGSIVAPIVAHSVYDVAAIIGYWFTRNS